MLVLDMSCKLLGDECKLDSFCAPFGRGDGKCTFLETIILVDYIQYMLIMDMSCQHLGDDCNLEGFFVPFGHTVGECTFLKIAILLDICCQQFGAYVSVEYICSYWIYHAKT